MAGYSLFNNIPLDLLEDLDRLFSKYDSPGWSRHNNNGSIKVVIRLGQLLPSVRPLPSSQTNNAKWTRMSDKQLLRENARHKSYSSKELPGRDVSGPLNQLDASAPEWMPDQDRVDFSCPPPPVSSATSSPPPLRPPQDSSDLTVHLTAPLARNSTSCETDATKEAAPPPQPEELSVLTVPAMPMCSPTEGSVSTPDNQDTPMEGAERPEPQNSAAVIAKTLQLSHLDESVEYARELYPMPMSPQSIVNGVCRCMFCGTELWDNDTCFLCVVCSAFDCGCDPVRAKTHKHA